MAGQTSVVQHDGDEAETLKALVAIVRKQLSIGDGDVGADTPLRELGATSIDIVEIVWTIEERYGIDIDLSMVDPNALNSVGTISQLARAIDAAVDQKRSGARQRAASL